MYEFDVLMGDMRINEDHITGKLLVKEILPQISLHHHLNFN
jgi:hypothetical protein